jgi:hypothetical protein
LKKNPFEEAQEILRGEKENEVENIVMVNKILSFHPKTALAAMTLNEIIWKAPNALLQNLFKLFPKNSGRAFLKFAKKTRLQEPELVNKVCKTFGVNTGHAQQIIALYRLKGFKPESFFGLKKGQ